MERYVPWNLQSVWNEWRVPSPSTFIFPPRVRKCHSKRLNSVDKWPTEVLLISMLRITTSTAKLLVYQGHGSQLATISLIAAKDVHP